MELALSLGGDPSNNPFSTSFLDRNEKKNHTITTSSNSGCIIGSSTTGRSGLNPRTSCMGLGLVLSSGSTKDEKMEDLATSEEERNDNVSGEDGKSQTDGDSNDDKATDEEEEEERRDSSSPSSDHNHNHQPVQLDLLPFSPVPRRQYQQQTTTNKSSHHQLGFRFPWMQHHRATTSASENLTVGFESGRPSSDRLLLPAPPVTTMEEQSSPNSAASSFVEFSPTTTTTTTTTITDPTKKFVEFSLYRPSGGNIDGSKNNKRPLSADRYLAINYGQQHHPESSSDPITAAGSRGSDDDENGGSTRKKLRLSKEQSAFLEESFKEHHTLNPKQKLALAKQLNLRPRQVEVWFQNRRARTKLKQTEVDCEYLKRCCETLTEENRRLQKELQELRALKTSQPFYMQLPPTTLTMCPSCERVATTTSTALPSTTTAAANKTTTSSVITRPIATVASVGGPTTALTLAKSTLPFATAQQQHSQPQAPRATTASS